MPETAAGDGFPFESSLIYYNGTNKKFGKYYLRAHLKEDKNQNADGQSVMADNLLCRDSRHDIYADPLEDGRSGVGEHNTVKRMNKEDKKTMDGGSSP